MFKLSGSTERQTLDCYLTQICNTTAVMMDMTHSTAIRLRGLAILLLSTTGCASLPPSFLETPGAHIRAPGPVLAQTVAGVFDKLNAEVTGTLSCDGGRPTIVLLPTELPGDVAGQVTADTVYLGAEALLVIPWALAHELVHFHVQKTGWTFPSHAIEEGLAYFVAEQIAGPGRSLSGRWCPTPELLQRALAIDTREYVEMDCTIEIDRTGMWIVEQLGIDEIRRAQTVEQLEEALNRLDLSADQPPHAGEPSNLEIEFSDPHRGASWTAGPFGHPAHGSVIPGVTRFTIRLWAGCESQGVDAPSDDRAVLEGAG